MKNVIMGIAPPSAQIARHKVWRKAGSVLERQTTLNALFAGMDRSNLERSVTMDRTPLRALLAHRSKRVMNARRIRLLTVSVSKSTIVQSSLKLLEGQCLGRK